MGDKKYYSQLSSSAYSKLNSGDIEGALEIIQELKSFSPNADALFKCSGLLIDIGDYIKSKDLTIEGIDILNTINYKGLLSEKYYYIGNGFYNLYKIEASENKFNHYFNPESNLIKAKKNHLKSLYYMDNDLKYFEKNVLMSRLLTNIGNMYDEIGRSLDALEFYENSLDYNPSNAMALGNLGVALDRYATLMGHYKTTLFLDAIQYLEKALTIGVYPQAQLYFKRKLTEIKKKINFPIESITKLKPEIKGKNDLDRHITHFCFENKLFLNLCNYCQRCSNSLKDPALIEICPESNQKLITYFNQIKQEYVTSRTILALSSYRGLDIDFIFDNVDLINVNDSTKDINVQILKISFKNFADILDKIAQFLNECLKLGIKERDVSFGKTLWYDSSGEIRENILKNKNPGLNALFDIYLDFKKGQYEKLTEMRNSITHRMVIIQENLEKESPRNMSKNTLRSKTIDLARIVRNAIMYLFYFVRIELKIVSKT